jgi:hypothetical protein
MVHALNQQQPHARAWSVVCPVVLGLQDLVVEALPSAYQLFHR